MLPELRYRAKPKIQDLTVCMETKFEVETCDLDLDLTMPSVKLV